MWILYFLILKWFYLKNKQTNEAVWVKDLIPVSDLQISQQDLWFSNRYKSFAWCISNADHDCVCARARSCVCVNKCKITQPCFDNLLLSDVAPNLKQLVASYRVLLRPSPAAPLQTDEHARAHFHTKHQLVPRQDAFIRRRMTPRVVFSKRVSSPVPVFTCPPARAARAHSLSPECVVEMDALRRVRARRETEAGPRRSAAVNKVKNNQVMADGGSLRARCR